MIRIFAGLTHTRPVDVTLPEGSTIPAAPYYAALQATGYPDTYIEWGTLEGCVRTLVESHRAAMRSRRASRRRRAS